MRAAAILFLHARNRCPPRAAARSLFFLLAFFARRRGIVLQRDDIPMRPSIDYPTESEVELELPAPPEEKKE